MIRKWKAKPTQDNLNPHFNCSYMIILFSNLDQVRSHIHMLSVAPREHFYQVIVASDRSKLSSRLCSLCASLNLSEYFITAAILILINPFSVILIPHLPGNEAWTWKWTFCRFCLSPFLDVDLLNYKNGNKCQEHNFRRGKVDKSSVSEWKSKRLWNDPDIKVQTSLTCYREMLLDWLEIIHQAGYKLAKFYVRQTRCNQSATQLILQ